MPDTDVEDFDSAIPLKRSARDPGAVRSALAQWLSPRLGARGAVSISPITAPNGTGVANETLLFDAAWQTRGKEHTQGFVVRVANDRPLYLEADIENHFKVYQALADQPDVPVPTVYGYEADPALLGAPFFVMERIEGDVPADNPHWRSSGFVVEASPESRRAMWEDAVRVLAALHQVDTSKVAFLSEQTGTGLTHHLDYWRRFLDAGCDGSPVETLERGYEWLRAHVPEPAPPGFSWGDSRFANIMFRGDRVVAVFDWDTASLSGAEADLAWWRFMDGPAADVLPGIGTADELVQRWESYTGRKVQHLEWYEVFTSFRLGVIMLNLYRNMAADGLMPHEVAARHGRQSGPGQILAAQLDDLR